MKKILVADDDQILRTVLKNFLEKQGFEVKDVASGKEGLEAFAQFVPDLVVSDVAMPVMNGLEFCRKLRSQPTGQLVPFIFLSGQNEVEDRIQGHSMGADDYLTKPFELKELLAKIQTQLDRVQRINLEMLRLMQNFQASQQPAPPPHPVKIESSQINEPTETQPLPLTPAEERVFWEVIQGKTNKQISECLFLSPRTVQTHVSSILNKLGLENRSRLVRFAYEQGYIPEEN
jgi:DNA-binding NarL/FixJ family response regulator